MPKIESINDVVVWIAEHDGRNNAYWEAQAQFNIKQEKKIAELDNRLTALEKKVMWVAGVASTVGAGGGATLASILLGG